MRETEQRALRPRPVGVPDGAPLALHLLGTFTLERDQEVLRVPRPTGRVLAYLAQARVSTRRTLAGVLWPDLTASRASANLRSALWRAHRTDGRLVRLDGDLVTLGSEVSVDLHRLESWIQSALLVSDGVQGTPPPGPSPGREVTLLPDWDDPWLDQPRQRLLMLQVQAFESVGEWLIGRGRPREAMPFVLAVVQACPLRESAHRLLIEIHLHQGNVPDALRHFEGYRRMLRAELGIEPGPRLAATISHAVATHRAGVTGIGA